MNTTKVWKYMLLACLFMLVAPAQAQRFFNLTSSEVRVDSVLPRFVYSIPLTGAYRDSVYTVSLKYGEYIDMTASDIANYNRLSVQFLLSRYFHSSGLPNAVSRAYSR